MISKKRIEREVAEHAKRTMIKKQLRGLCPSDATACSPRWRLLTEGDKIQVGDELLRDDCETWEAYEAYPDPGHHFIGCGYTPNLFVPIRRRIIPENVLEQQPALTQHHDA